MSGHNRWSKIKHKKEASDSKKSKVWTKVIKELTLSARLGGGDINGNPRLRAASDKARSVNMPNDTIDRAIKKGTGDLEGVNYEEFNYEVFGPGGAAVLVEIMTDNRNRTASDIRSVITRHGGNLAPPDRSAGCSKSRASSCSRRRSSTRTRSPSWRSSWVQTTFA